MRGMRCHVGRFSCGRSSYVPGWWLVVVPWISRIVKYIHGEGAYSFTRTYTKLNVTYTCTHTTPHHTTPHHTTPHHTTPHHTTPHHTTPHHTTPHHTAHRTPHTAHRTPHTAHRTPHTAHRTPHTAPHTAHRTPHTAHRTHLRTYMHSHRENKKFRLVFMISS